MHDLILPDTYVALKLFNDTIRLAKVSKGSHISIGKYGSIAANQLIGRPYFLTFELPDKARSDSKDLRIVPASELNEIAVNAGNAADESLQKEDVIDGEGGVEYEVIEGSNEIILRSNKDTIDEASRQTLSMSEIEAIKKESDFSGRDLIERLLASHTALNEKSAYSLAKYLKKKTKKYIRGFTVLPLDVSTLVQYIYADKEPPKIMELSEEALSLIGSLANVHCASTLGLPPELAPVEGSYGRWLVVDDTGGLVVAALAERMGILHPEPIPEPPPPAPDAPRQRPPRILPMSATSTTITVVHANTQPNLSVLKYFGFDRDVPAATHPLYRHLKSVSWLQVVSPEHDSGYQEPDRLPEETLRAMKSGKKGNYYRKIRRWERIRNITDETRAGGFDGLIVASTMQPMTILQHTLPLLRGSAPVVVYSAHVEPLLKLMEKFAMTRRKDSLLVPAIADDGIDPLSLMSTNIHTVKMRRWQCLPGRTHPLMTSRGGAEGYIFHGLKAITAETAIVARGKYKRQKIKASESETSGALGIRLDSKDIPQTDAMAVEEEKELDTADLVRMDTPPLEPTNNRNS